MEIIREGRLPKILVTCNFGRCNTELAVTPADLIPPTKSPLKRFYFKCPMCGTISEIPSRKVDPYFESTYRKLNECLEKGMILADD